MRVDQGNAYQEFLKLFHIGGAGRDLTPYKAPPPPAVLKDNPLAAAGNAKNKETANSDLVPIIDVRNASPREISELGMDFYAAGILGWREYEMLAFQAELQPGFNNTIGALIGEKADPGRRRDFIGIWEDRLAFERRYNPTDLDLIDRTQHIAEVLRRIESPASYMI
ncbi:MAG TPA: hypothetical protein ENI79_00680 [Rhodospirillales bacterium]|nr:hypothetical protein [Rhodospirillales bacterium]